MKLMLLTTVPQSLAFFSGLPRFLQSRGIAVIAVSSPGEDLDRFAEAEGISFRRVPMARRAAIWQDLVSLVKLVLLMGSQDPDIVDANTPKAGFLGIIAAWIARVPVRVYHVHGLPYEGQRGVKRSFLKFIEYISCLLATRVLCVSESIARVMIRDRLVAERKVRVILHGSINGVDAGSRFCPARVARVSGARTREAWGLPENVPVIGFVGRIAHDKGVDDLATAWRTLRVRFPSAHLLVVGEIESLDPILPETHALFVEDSRVHLTGKIDQVESAYSVLDVLVLPSYREGFGTVLLEAAAMEVPVVATSVSGCVDAVQDGVTGTLVPPGDPDALACAIARYLQDDELRRQHGKAGRLRVLRDFKPSAIQEALYREYIELTRHGR